MKAQEVESLRAVEDTHFWFRARRRALTPWWRAANAEAPEGPWLELGVGTGGNLESIRTHSGTRTLLALDTEQQALAHVRRRDRHAPGLRADAAHLPFRNASLSIVTLLDVLEHAQDDSRVLSELSRCLQPGGQVLLTVPAWPGLFGDHDRALGHHRRYRPRELEQRLEAAGFEILESRGFNLLLLPAVGIWRTVRGWRPSSTPPRSDVFRLPPGLNALLGAILALENALPRRISQGSGLSWWIRARRRTPT